MKFEKTLTMNLGHYESLKLGVSDASDFAAADAKLCEELQQINLPHISNNIRRAINYTQG